MAAPQLLIPIDATWIAELAARKVMQSDAAWKVEIDDDLDTVYTDYTGYLDNNQVQISAAADIFKSAQASSAKLVFRNSPKLLTEGDLSLCPIKISARIGAASFIQVFAGFVEAQGAQRGRGSGLTQDTVSITAYDLLKSKAVNRRCSAEALINFKICDTSSTATSIFHHIASIAGLTTSDLDVMDIALVKDYLPLSKDDKVLSRLQELAIQHGAFLGVRYDGKLRLLVWTEAEWNAATPEYTFDSSNVRKWSGGGGSIFCNHAHTEFTEFEVLPAGVVYQNYDQWNKDAGQNEIAVAAGAYWPGGSDALAVGRLNYGFNGEKYPVAISLIEPTIGYKGTGTDIQCEGGLLEISSWNGSDANTTQNVDSSEIILHNPTGSTVYIRQFKVRGTPLRKKTQNIVDYEDPAIADPSLEVLVNVPGDFATSAVQAKATVKRFVDFGKEGRKEFEVEVDFTPHMQCGAIVRFNPSADTDVDCVVTRYSHKSIGPHSNNVTTLSLVERIDKTDAGAGTHVAGSPGATGAGTGTDILEQIANRPVFASVFHGFVATGGTTTPTVPTLQICSGVYHGILLMWDEQLNLSNFSHYEVQVSDDHITWYALKMDETDWKGASGGVTEVTQSILVHTGLSTQTLYYKVRRVTSAGVASAYSTYQVATASDVANADAAFNNMFVNKLIVGLLQTVFAQVSSELIIGSSYDLGENPVEGDRKIVIHNDMLAEMVFAGGTWVTLIQIGGTGLLKDYLQARGIVQVGADLSALDAGDPMPAGFKRFKFDADYVDELGTDPWSTKTNASIVTDAAFVRGTVLKLLSGVLTDAATNLWTHTNSCAIDLQFRLPGLVGAVLFQLITNTTSDKNAFIAQMSGDGLSVLVYVRKNGVDYIISLPIADMTKWHHLSAGYDAVNDKLYMVLDGVSTQSVGAIGGAFAAAGTKNTRVSGLGADVRISDLIFKLNGMLDSTIAASITKAQAHYATGQPWSYSNIDALNDLMLIAKDAGKIRMLSDTEFFAPVAGELAEATLKRFPRDTTSRLIVNSLALPAAGAWSAAQTASGPDGMRGIIVDVTGYINASAVSAKTLMNLYFSDNNSNTPGNTSHPHFYFEFVPISGVTATYTHTEVRELRIPVNASKQFYIYCIDKQNIGSADVSVIQKGYY